MTADGFALVTIGSLQSGWGQLRAYDLTAGNVLAWISDSNELLISSPPLVERDGTIRCLDNSGRLYTFKVVRTSGPSAKTAPLSNIH